MGNTPTTFQAPPTRLAPVVDGLPEPTALVRHGEVVDAVQAPAAVAAQHARILSSHEGLQRLCVVRPPTQGAMSVLGKTLVGGMFGTASLGTAVASLASLGSYAQEPKYVFAAVASGAISIVFGLTSAEIFIDLGTAIIKPGDALPAGEGVVMRNSGFTNRPRWHDLLFGNSVVALDDIDEQHPSKALAFMNDVTVEKQSIRKYVVTGKDISVDRYEINLTVCHNGKNFDLRTDTADHSLANAVERLPVGANISVLFHKSTNGIIGLYGVYDTQVEDESLATDVTKNASPYHFAGLRIDTNIIGDERLNALPEDKRRDVLVSLVAMIFEETDKVRRNGFLDELVTEHLTLLDEHYRAGVTAAIAENLASTEKEIRDSALKALDKLRRFGLLTADDKESLSAKIRELSTSENPDISHDMLKALGSWK